MERRIGQASGVKPRGSRRSGYFLAAAATDQCQQVPCGGLRSRVRIHDVGGSASISVACRVAARGPTEQLDQLEVAISIGVGHPGRRNGSRRSELEVNWSPEQARAEY